MPVYSGMNRIGAQSTAAWVASALLVVGCFSTEGTSLLDDGTDGASSGGTTADSTSGSQDDASAMVTPAAATGTSGPDDGENTTTGDGDDGASPPGYLDVFADDFEDVSLGNADLPATSTWNPYSANVAMIGGRLQLSGGFTLGIRAQAAEAIGSNNARLRAIVRLGTSNAWPRVLWGLSGAPQAAEDSLGFFIFNNNDDSHLHLHAYGGDSSVTLSGQNFATATNYYVEVVADGPFSAATVRASSHTGPVVVVTTSNETGIPAASGDDVGVGNSGGGTVQVDEMLLSRYASGL